MKRQLQVVVALAVLGACLVAASAVAGSIKIGLGSDEVSIDLPGGADLEPLGVLPDCANLKDDDGDGRTDLGDPGCSGPLDGNEYNAPAPSPDPDDGGGTGGGGGHTPGGGGGTDPSPGTAGPAGPDGAGKGKVAADREEVNGNRDPMAQPEPRAPDGTPTNSNPTVTVADFGPAPIGVPNFIIDQFTIPPF